MIQLNQFKLLVKLILEKSLKVGSLRIQKICFYKLIRFVKLCAFSDFLLGGFMHFIKINISICFGLIAIKSGLFLFAVVDFHAHIKWVDALMQVYTYQLIRNIFELIYCVVCLFETQFILGVCSTVLLYYMPVANHLL